MEHVTNLVHSALTSIGAAQAFAVALTTGFIMKDYSQTIMLTLCALVADRAIVIGRNAFGGQPVDAVIKTNWHDFLTLPMGNFLAVSISFALIIIMSFYVKTLLRKL